MAETQARTYAARAASTATFGRVLASCRDQHFVVDGPVQNGCPGEAPTPAELFLSGVASCGVELLHVIARNDKVPLDRVAVEIEGTLDRSKPIRSDVTLLNSVRIAFRLGGVTKEQGEQLISAFKNR